MFRRGWGCDVLPLLDEIPGRDGLLVMLKVYLDRGARRDADGVMCVSGAVFKPREYKQFVRAWNVMLNTMPGGKVPYFHATDFFTGGGIYRHISHPDRERVARLLPSLIDEHTYQFVTATFKEAEFNAVAPPLWRAQFGGVHAVAAQMCAGAIGHWANERKYYGPIAYFFESGDDDEAEVGRRFEGISKNPPLKKHIRYHSHAFVDKGNARGLEVADYFAWQWNKFDAETITPWAEDREFRDMRQDFRALVMSKTGKYRVFRFVGEQLDQMLLKFGCRRKDDVESSSG